jgi:hypothetical protein
LEIIVFLIYLLLFNWLITRIPFFIHAGINKWVLIVLFTLKVLAGLGYAWFYQQPAYFEGSDTWRYFNISLGETDWLLKDPIAFWKDIFVSGYTQPGNLFSGNNSYWNDLKSNIVIKLLAICNVFTGKNYYAAIPFFNFLFFFGPIALYRLAKQVFNIHTYVLIACLFLLPSVLFWCSGIHKDGLILSATALILYFFQQQLLQNKLSISNMLIILFCVVVVFALRNFMALLLLPALLVWLIIWRYQVKSWVVVAAVYGLGIILFFVSPYFSESANLPGYVIEKQTEFKQLSGSSLIAVPPLENNINSFIHFLPSAFDIAFFRPHITEIKNKSYIPAATEIICLWLFVLTAIIMGYKNKNNRQQQALTAALLCFAISFLLLAGFTIPFSGAIVRYRAVILPFLLIPVLPLLPKQFKWLPDKQP